MIRDWTYPSGFQILFIYTVVGKLSAAVRIWGFTPESSEVGDAKPGPGKTPHFYPTLDIGVPDLT